MVASGVTDIRWIIEDTFKYVQREVKRGNKYDGIILDPPAYGRGPKGEKWLLQNQLNELMKLCNVLLQPSNSFLVLNMFSMGFSALIAENLVRTIFKDIGLLEAGELFLSDRENKKLPLGIFVRFLR